MVLPFGLVADNAEIVLADAEAAVPVDDHDRDAWHIVVLVGVAEELVFGDQAADVVVQRHIHSFAVVHVVQGGLDASARDALDGFGADVSDVAVGRDSNATTAGVVPADNGES